MFRPLELFIFCTTAIGPPVCPTVIGPFVKTNENGSSVSDYSTVMGPSV